MFDPDEVIFAPTGRCNLACAHCRVRRDAGELRIDEAVTFLSSCAEAGVARVGFSGGEPFLRLDFLTALTAAAVDAGMFFDRLMTNGDWWRSEAELREALDAVYGAGFDGTLGLSHDAYHRQPPERVAAFLSAVFAVSGRRDAAELLSVRSSDDEGFLAGLTVVAERLGGRLELDGKEPVRIVDEAFLRRSPADPDDGAALSLPIQRFPRSLGAAEDGWGARAWFRDDYCEGPGNVLYVHPDGRVAVCCGFANERPELCIGTIGDSYATLMENAASSPVVRARYDTGLGALRERLEARGERFPGKADDPCFFCDYLCSRGLG